MSLFSVEYPNCNELKCIVIDVGEIGTYTCHNCGNDFIATSKVEVSKLKGENK